MAPTAALWHLLNVDLAGRLLRRLRECPRCDHYRSSCCAAPLGHFSLVQLCEIWALANEILELAPPAPPPPPARPVPLVLALLLEATNALLGVSHGALDQGIMSLVSPRAHGEVEARRLYWRPAKLRALGFGRGLLRRYRLAGRFGAPALGAVVPLGPLAPGAFGGTCQTWHQALLTGTELWEQLQGRVLPAVLWKLGTTRPTALHEEGHPRTSQVWTCLALSARLVGLAKAHVAPALPRDVAGALPAAAARVHYGTSVDAGRLRAFFASALSDLGTTDMALLAELVPELVPST